MKRWATLGILIFSRALIAAQAEPVSFEGDVRPILNKRCVACHSCFDAPCQLNLQSLDGLRRGGARENFLTPMRFKPAAPTRIFEDAQTVQQWRERGFHGVADGAGKSIFARMVNLAAKRTFQPKTPVAESKICPMDSHSMENYETMPELAMPYGFPALVEAERQTLNKWAAQGEAKAEPLGEMSKLGVERLPAAAKAEVRRWEAMLNRRALNDRIVARYLYEHFFLAHFYQAQAPTRFLKLARSTQACEKGVVAVRARRPNDDPGVADWRYCFYEDPSVAVYKNHIPYEMSGAKREWIERHFKSAPWKARAFPSFDPAVATNPMLAFQDIPAALRYRFLLEDARYHVMTFIKGPVCNGNVAVNVIQERFYIFFMDPLADLMSISPAFDAKSAALLGLPSTFGEPGRPLKALETYKKLVELRNAYRDLHDAELARRFPKGLGLEDVWNGDGRNRNALLTVFRHGDNADVQFGARGDATKTAFVLDYGLFERLVYDLVVNFDPSGDIGHQALTRLYMDLIRMEAERNYLTLLPPDLRLPRLRSWYVGAAAEKKLDELGETRFPTVPSRAPIETGKDAGEPHVALLRALIFDRIPAAARGPDDLVNWKRLRSSQLPDDALDRQMQLLASTRAADSTPYARFFPELSALYVRRASGDPRIYSIARDREHQNIAWMFGEDDRLAPDEDSLTIQRGALGGYLNDLFYLNESDVGAFVADALKLKSKEDFDGFAKRWATLRTDPAFWPRYDALTSDLAKESGREGGILDLTRFRM